MKSLSRLLLASLAIQGGVLTEGRAEADPEDTEVIVVTGGDRFLRWQGQPGRTYFIQASDPNFPLQSWDWMPGMIEYGAGVEISHEIVTNADKAFFRLWHTDLQAPAGVSLEEWDADEDGLTNLDEIDFWGTNPLLSDTSGDGIPDGWAAFFGLDPRLDNAASPFQGGPTTCLVAFIAGVQALPGATVDDHDGDLIPNTGDSEPTVVDELRVIVDYTELTVQRDQGGESAATTNGTEIFSVDRAFLRDPQSQLVAPISSVQHAAEGGSLITSAVRVEAAEATSHERSVTFLHVLDEVWWSILGPNPNLSVKPNVEFVVPPLQTVSQVVNIDPDVTELTPATGTLSKGAFLVPVDVELDVNGDEDLDDLCDGLKQYMPGYELDQAKLHQGPSFETASYSGPQSMNLIIENLPSNLVDQAHVKLASSSWHGYCSNGELPGDQVLLPFNDFSFDGQNQTGLLQETTVTIAGDRLIIPLRCHDYGGWCEVELQFMKDGSPLTSESIFVTVPHDRNGDRLADHWQDAEIAAWNGQFGASRPLNDTERSKMKPGGGVASADYADDEEIDSDGISNGDGGRNLPPMASVGDSLRVIDEYRGYVLDLGKGVSGGEHRRFGTARKEALLQIHEMVEIGDTAENNSNIASQQFDLEERFITVASFFSDVNVGASIDLYGVRILISDGGPAVTYADGSSRPAAYKWTGSLASISGTSRPLSGGSYVYRDKKLDDDFPSDHISIFESYVEGSPGRLNIFPRLRNEYLDKFSMLAVFSRLGSIEERNGSLVATENGWGNATTNHGSSVPDQAFRQKGVQISVNSISEETAPAYAPPVFDSTIEYSFAHEIGHMLIWSQFGGHYGVGMTLMSDSRPDPVSLEALMIDDGEISLIDLPSRLSTQP